MVMKQPENLAFPMPAWDTDEKSLTLSSIFDKRNSLFLVFKLQLTPCLQDGQTH